MRLKDKILTVGLLFTLVGVFALTPLGVSAPPPQVGPDYFTEQVYPVFEEAECRICHNDNGVASSTRLRFPPEGVEDAAIKAFGLRLVALVDRGDVEQSLLLNKPTQRVAHAGGERLKKGGPEEQALRTWSHYLASVPETTLRQSLAALEEERRLVLKDSGVRRLTHSQYNNTVRDLLGDFTRPADQFPAEEFLEGFKNQAEAQTIPPLLAEAYMNAAEKMAINAFRQGDSHGLIPCENPSTGDTACQEQFIRSFGLKAFRRPLTEEEVQGYAELFTEEAVEAGTFIAGAKVVVEGMLQSPSFLFHLEAGPDNRWVHHETASRLSYFLWDTMPDEALFAAAEAGELSSMEQIESWTRRMLDNPRAKRSMENFLGQWMRFDRVLAAVRNARTYPDFSPSLLPVMTEETKHLFNYLVWQDKNFMEIFNADYSFLSARLAQFYKVAPPAEEFGMVKYPAESTRAGILGHAGFLTLTSSPSDTSPTSRGLFVREHFLCQSVPPPPPGVDANLPPVRADKPLTNRERLSMHVSNASCATCHDLIDPIGLGFERYDNLGQYRAKQVLSIVPDGGNRRDAKEIELEIDTTARIAGITGSQFETVKELGEILSNEEICQKCVVKQIFRYALGRHETEADQPHLDEMFNVFQESGFRFRELLVSLVKSRPFLGDAAPTVMAQSKDD